MRAEGARTNSADRQVAVPVMAAVDNTRHPAKASGWATVTATPNPRYATAQVSTRLDALSATAAAILAATTDEYRAGVATMASSVPRSRSTVITSPAAINAIDHSDMRAGASTA